MDLASRIESCLRRAIAWTVPDDDSMAIVEAVRYAVFPGGARTRPRLCHAVADACGGRFPGAVDASATAIELLHCASLVHDDLPCFDDALVRRSKPSVHARFGEQVAVLTGDALIVLAFETIARESDDMPDGAGRLVCAVAQGVGMPSGIIVGQAWESEDDIPLKAYHRAKTGGLFRCAAIAGAIAGGADDIAPWSIVGEELGAAYQIADDLHDVFGDGTEAGKPEGQDVRNGRPNTAIVHGVAQSLNMFRQHVQLSIEAIPPTVASNDLRTIIVREANSILPRPLAQHAA